MRSIFTMALKDLRLISCDGIGVFFIVCFPVLMGLLFGTMYNWVGNNDSVNMTIAIVDEDRSEMSTQFIDSLKSSNSLNLVPLEREEAMNQVRRGQYVGMIVLPNGYGKKAGIMWEGSPEIELGIDPARKAEASMLEGIVMQASGMLMMERFQDPSSLTPQIEKLREEIASQRSSGDAVEDSLRPYLFDMLTELNSFLISLNQLQETEANLVNQSNLNQDNESKPSFQLAEIKSIDVTYEPAQGTTDDFAQKLRSRWDITFPQGMMWGVLACSAAFAISIVRERKQGTLLRLEAAPIERRSVLLGKALACFLAVLGVIALMTLLGVFLGMRPQSPILLIIATLSVTFCFVGIMILMSVIGKTEEAVSGAAWASNMLMAMFGGGMMPLAFMPSFMVTISHASPVKWSILALEGAIWRGLSPTEMIFPCGLLVLIGASTMALGAIRYSISRA